MNESTNRPDGRVRTDRHQAVPCDTGRNPDRNRAGLSADTDPSMSAIPVFPAAQTAGHVVPPPPEPLREARTDPPLSPEHPVILRTADDMAGQAALLCTDRKPDDRDGECPSGQTGDDTGDDGYDGYDGETTGGRDSQAFSDPENPDELDDPSHDPSYDLSYDLSHDLSHDPENPSDRGFSDSEDEDSPERNGDEDQEEEADTDGEDGDDDEDDDEDGDGEEDTIAEQRQQEIERRFHDLEELLDNRRYNDFRTEIDTFNPVDVADFFAGLQPARIPTVFKLIDKDTAADVFAELDIEQQERIITAMTDKEISRMVEDLAMDDATEMLKELPANIVRRIMLNATPETRSGINRFLAYPDASAGSVMTAEFIDLRRDMTCEEAINHIREKGVDKETVYIAYVTDNQRILQGSVPLKSLLFASRDTRVSEIMDEEIICASTLDDQETVANIISKYDMLALPIVDKENRLVGIVTVDDAMDVLETEVTEDIEKMAAIVPTDKPYLKTGVLETWKKRIPWLLLLMISATFTSTILTHYESALSAMAILTAFVPMLMDTGGNAGGQTSVTIIRSLSLGEIDKRDVLRVLWKEVQVAALCGITVAGACFLKTMLIDFRFSFTFANIKVSLIVCLTMFCTILLAKIVGALLPIGAKCLGFDPAVMASPFITTIVDTLTLLIYFAVASAVLGL